MQKYVRNLIWDNSHLNKHDPLDLGIMYIVIFVENHRFGLPPRTPWSMCVPQARFLPRKNTPPAFFNTHKQKKKAGGASFARHPPASVGRGRRHHDYWRGHRDGQYEGFSSTQSGAHGLVLGVMVVPADLGTFCDRSRGEGGRARA